MPASWALRTVLYTSSISWLGWPAWTKAVEAQFIPASDLLTTLRQVKDADELAAMREAQRVTDEALLENMPRTPPPQ